MTVEVSESYTLTQLSRFHDLALRGSTRMIWAPLLANGAGVVAMVNIVANSPHQDQALAALSLPVTFFGLGLLVSLLGAQRWLGAVSQLSNAALTAGSTLEAAKIAQAKLQELTGAPDLPDQARQMARVEEMQKLTKRMGEYAIKLQEIQSWQPKTVKDGKIADWLSSLGVALCGGGFVVLLLGHALGSIQLEPVAAHITRERVVAPVVSLSDQTAKLRPAPR